MLKFIFAVNRKQKVDCSSLCVMYLNDNLFSLQPQEQSRISLFPLDLSLHLHWCSSCHLCHSGRSICWINRFIISIELTWYFTFFNEKTNILLIGLGFGIVMFASEEPEYFFHQWLFDRITNISHQRSIDALVWMVKMLNNSINWKRYHRYICF